MHSLRLRIAVWYTLLLVVAIGALGIAVTMRFQSILHAQAEQHLALTLQDMERALAPEPGSFLFNGPGTLLALENPDNLERWSSVNTFIEVDDLRGYTLAKSFNMGSLESFGNPGLTPREPRSTREIVAGGRRFLIESVLFVSGNVGLVVQIGEPLDALDQAFHDTEISIGAILLVTAIALAVLSFVLANEITSPLDRLADAMREIGSEGLHRRIRWKGRQDEVGALAQAFDDLLARLQEAFARERRFISDASHELKTPLTSINANAQMLARWGDRDEAIRAESLQTIIAESSSLAGMVNGMLTLAKADSGDDVPKEPVSLGAVAREAVHATQSRAAEKGLTLTLGVPDEPPIVYGDASLLRQLVTNLVDNAIKFTAQGGVTVTVSQSAEDAIVEIADTGPGIDPDEIPLIFDRFYRTDKSRTRAVPGTGLGLAIVRSIARVHDGTVTARAGEDGGTVFRVTLPCIH